MMAFLKASDERTYAARRASRKSLRQDYAQPPSRAAGFLCRSLPRPAGERPRRLPL